MGIYNLYVSILCIYLFPIYFLVTFMRYSPKYYFSLLFGVYMVVLPIHYDHPTLAVKSPRMCAAKFNSVWVMYVIKKQRPTMICEPPWPEPIYM